MKTGFDVKTNFEISRNFGWCPSLLQVLGLAERVANEPLDALLDQEEPIGEDGDLIDSPSAILLFELEGLVVAVIENLFRQLVKRGDRRAVSALVGQVLVHPLFKFRGEVMLASDGE